MFRERSEEIKFSLIIMDLCLAFFAYVIAFSIRFFVMNQDLSDFRQLELPSYIFQGLLLAVFQIVIFMLMNFYSPRRFLSFLDEISVIILGVFFNIICSMAILYFFKIYEVSRILPLLYGTFILLFVVIGHNVFRKIILHKRERGKDLKDVLIIGDGVSARKTATVIENNRLFGLRVLGFVSEEPQDLKEGYVGRIAELDSLIEKHKPSYIIYAGHSDYHENLKMVLGICDNNGIHLQVVPSYSELITVNGQIENYDGLPVISIRDIPSRVGLNRVVKRTFDLIFSFVFITVFSPIYILIALLVKLSSKGPVFFLQERVGLDNKVFKMFKFRTMKVQDAKASATIWTTKDDPRVTKIGKFLRKSSLDEIPQFFNILLGQMSVVGPRPERPFYVEQFKDQYRYFKRRHAVKAGLTGWAQINGFRGDTSIQDRIDADIFYIENWSFFLDIKIILLTPFKGMVSKNAY